MTSIPKDWVESYFEYGVDKANRRIFLMGDVDQIVIGNVIKGIYYMNSEDSEKPIELFINTDGGSEYDMFALYDVLQTITCPIETFALGRVMSAGPLLVAAGTQGSRWAGENTHFMVHQAWGDYWGSKQKEVSNTVKHHESMAHRWCKLMEKHTKLKASQWKKLREDGVDSYFDADKALEYGLVDHLWKERDD